MERQKLFNVLHYYYESCTLKEVERTGWKLWNVSRDKRIESIPEHVYGTQHLALAIFSEFDLDIDIYKVITMLSLHESEEIIIGDKTEFDGISEADRRTMGKAAVDETFSKLRKKQFFISIINEFNQRKTPESIFAYLCDKMECNLQAKKYSDEGRCSLATASSLLLEDARIQEIISNGAQTAADVFIDFDAHRYVGNDIFSDMIQFLKNYSTENN